MRERRKGKAVNRDEAMARISQLTKAADLAMEALAVVDAVLAQWPDDPATPHAIDRAAVALLAKEMRGTAEHAVATRNALTQEMYKGRYESPATAYTHTLPALLLRAQPGLTCVECRGSGIDRSDGVRCSVCGGSGAVFGYKAARGALSRSADASDAEETTL